MKVAAVTLGTLAALNIVAVLACFIAGIWIDERFGATGVVLFLFGIPLTTAAVIVIDEATS